MMVIERRTQMGLLFACALMGLPLAYALWSLAQDRSVVQAAGHTAGPPREDHASLTSSRDAAGMRPNSGPMPAEAAHVQPGSQPSDGYMAQLAILQTRLIDVLAGFRTMQEKAEPELRPIVDDYIATHSRHERELAEHLVSLGREADDDGSFFSVVQKSVVRVRSVFTDLGTNTVPQIIDGEKNLMDIYRETLDQATSQPDKSLIERQINELSELIDRTDIELHGRQSPSTG
jgi:uncharacterized protein (TIGR02284 family)